MKVYLYDKDTGVLKSVRELQKDPRSEGKYLRPNHATDKEPDLSKAETHIIKFLNGDWTYELIPEPLSYEEQIEASLTPLEKEARRVNKKKISMVKGVSNLFIGKKLDNIGLSISDSKDLADKFLAIIKYVELGLIELAKVELNAINPVGQFYTAEDKLELEALLE